jgi:hypothetical protein
VHVDAWRAQARLGLFKTNQATRFEAMRLIGT